MKKILALACCGILLQAGPVHAQTADITAEDPHLHLIKNTSNELVARPFGYRHHHYRGEVIYNARRIDLYITKGPFRISERDFIDLIERSGADPALIERIRAHQAEGWRNGTVSVLAFAGSLATGIAAGTVYYPQGGIIPNATASTTSAVASFVLAGVGVIYGLFWLGDLTPKGAPYFQEFTPAQAQQAINDYNRLIDQQQHVRLPDGLSEALRAESPPPRTGEGLVL